jgi:hypothetical protein
MSYLCFIVRLGVFGRAVRVPAAPGRLGFGEIYAAMLALQHSINVCGGAAWGMPGAGFVVERAFDVAENEPEGENDKNET